MPGPASGNNQTGRNICFFLAAPLVVPGDINKINNAYARSGAAGDRFAIADLERYITTDPGGVEGLADVELGTGVFRVPAVTTASAYGSTTGSASVPRFCGPPISVPGSTTLTDLTIGIAPDYAETADQTYFTNFASTSIADGSDVIVIVRIPGAGVSVSYNLVLGKISGLSIEHAVESVSTHTRTVAPAAFLVGINKPAG